MLTFAPVRVVIFWLLGLIVGLVKFVVVDLLLYIVLIVAGLYAWLRLPTWMGFAFTKLMTPLVLFDIPIGFETVRVRPYLTLFPLTIHFDVLVTNFFLGNAVHIQCRDENMVTAKNIVLAAFVDLSFLSVRHSPAQPKITLRLSLSLSLTIQLVRSRPCRTSLLLASSSPLRS